METTTATWIVALTGLGSIGMLLGERWGFLLALMASVPFWYTAVFFYIWDRDLGFRENTLSYWLFIWGMWPAFGVVEGVYCYHRFGQTGLRRNCDVRGIDEGCGRHFIVTGEGQGRPSVA